jgi:hypothetical protein
VCRTVAAADVDAVTPEDAEAAMHEWATIEHAAATAKALFGARAATGAAVRDAGARDAGEWMARRTGTTGAQGRDAVATARRLKDLPATDAAARRGVLSPAQAAAIADAASVAPAAEQRLLDAAARESVGELRDRCARTKAAADPDPEATRRRIHDARRVRRFSTSDGLHHFQAAGPADAIAQIDAALKPFTEARFKHARQAGERERFEAYEFDAFVAMATAASSTSGEDTPAPKARHRIIVRADLEALVRGWVDDGEVCEITGLPMSAVAVRDLLGQSVLDLVLTKGKDVCNVTHLGRGPTAAQRIALLWQAPVCSREGCNRRGRLEIDHTKPWAQTKVTRLVDLDHLCHHDHHLKTHQGWALVEGTGTRAMVPPGHPDHPTRPPPPGDPPAP